MVKAGRKPSAETQLAEHAAALGMAIRDGRDAAGLSQAEVAAATGHSASWISKLERGQIVEPGLFPVLSVLRAIGQGDVGDLLGAVTPER